jgi:hypothetical protein
MSRCLLQPSPTLNIIDQTTELHQHLDELGVCLRALHVLSKVIDFADLTSNCRNLQNLLANIFFYFMHIAKNDVLKYILMI